MSLYKKMLHSNKLFWKKNNIRDGSNGTLLYECLYSDDVLLYGVNKVALTIANIKQLRPVGVCSLTKVNQNKLAKSLNGLLVGGVGSLFKYAFLNFFTILGILRKINSKSELLKLDVDGCNIGTHLYDLLLRMYTLQEINEVKAKLKLRLFIELVYFYFFKSVIQRYDVRVIVIGDAAYRLGMLFKLAEKNRIECFTPVSLNDFSITRYSKADDFIFPVRMPDIAEVNSILFSKASTWLDDYFAKRYSGDIEQHDVINAFSSDKKIYDKNDFFNEYGLNKNLPLVVVMSHIFCDAPHAYPGMLYSDYKEWLVCTIESLLANNSVNFLVKEHPSSKLYNESGTVGKILEELGAPKLLIKDDIHTKTILECSDVVVTCGGTIGQEFSALGKPVVLAARPPYSGFGFTVEPFTREEYEFLLSSDIQNLKPLSSEKTKLAVKLSYYAFNLLNNHSDSLELGGQRVMLGKSYDTFSLCKNIISYNNVALCEQEIYLRLRNFISSDLRNMTCE